MAHSHDTDSDSYYLDQVCLVGISAAFGGVCLALYYWQTDMLNLILGRQFHPFVVISGYILVVMAAVRSVILWRQSSARHAHAHHHHDHSHAHAHHHHDHDHAHCHHHAHEGIREGEPALASAAVPPTHEHTHAHTHAHGHGHDHDHDHSWAPWRYVVLLIPIMLFLLNLPNKGLSVEGSTIDMTREMSEVTWLIGLGHDPLQGAAAVVARTVDPLAKEVPIFIKGAPATLADLEPGMPVTVKLFRDRRLVGGEGVAEIQAGEATNGAPSGDALLRTGTIKEVEVPRKRLIVTLRQQGNPVDHRYDLGQGPVFAVDLKLLEAMGFTKDRRQEWAGKTVQVVGQFAPSGNPRAFTLARYRMQCCAGDAVQVSVPVILGEGSVANIPPNQWLQVIGRVDFVQQPGRSGEQTILRVPFGDEDTVKKTPPEPDPWLR